MFNQETHGDVTGLKIETVNLSSLRARGDDSLIVLYRRLWWDWHTVDIEQRWVEYLLWRRVWNSFCLPPPGQQPSSPLFWSSEQLPSLHFFPGRTRPKVDLYRTVVWAFTHHVWCQGGRHSQTQCIGSIGICQLVLSTDRVFIAWVNRIQGVFCL